MDKTKRRELITATVRDLVINFMYYDRKEDEDLPVGAIEDAVAEGVITWEEIIEVFRTELLTDPE